MYKQEAEGTERAWEHLSNPESGGSPGGSRAPPQQDLMGRSPRPPLGGARAASMPRWPGQAGTSEAAQRCNPGPLTQISGNHQEAECSDQWTGSFSKDTLPLHPEESGVTFSTLSFADIICQPGRWNEAGGGGTIRPKGGEGVIPAVPPHLFPETLTSLGFGGRPSLPGRSRSPALHLCPAPQLRGHQ